MREISEFHAWNPWKYKEGTGDPPPTPIEASQNQETDGGHEHKTYPAFEVKPLTPKISDSASWRDKRQFRKMENSMLCKVICSTGSGGIYESSGSGGVDRLD